MAWLEKTIWNLSRQPRVFVPAGNWCRLDMRLSLHGSFL